MFIWALAATVVYLLFLAFAMQTQNVMSSILFRFIPIMLVLFLLVTAGIHFGWITLPSPVPMSL